MLLHRCMHCLAANACELRFDKKAKPYTSCTLCRTRCFFSDQKALRGVGVVPSLLDQALQARATDPAFRARFDAELSGIMSYIQQRISERLDPGYTEAAPTMGIPNRPQIVPFDENVG